MLLNLKIEEKLIDLCQCPSDGLPSSPSDDPMEEVQAVTETKPFATKCVYARFDDQQHGFCAARGDWSNENIASAATRAIGIMTQFCIDNLVITPT